MKPKNFYFMANAALQKFKNVISPKPVTDSIKYAIKINIKILLPY